MYTQSHFSLKREWHLLLRANMRATKAADTTIEGATERDSVLQHEPRLNVIQWDRDMYIYMLSDVMRERERDRKSACNNSQNGCGRYSFVPHVKCSWVCVCVRAMSIGTNFIPIQRFAHMVSQYAYIFDCAQWPNSKWLNKQKFLFFGKK